MCARYEDGRIKPNHYGEKVITLIEWGYLLSPQRVALRRQSIGRADWEKLPWKGHLCCLFTRSWGDGSTTFILLEDTSVRTPETLPG